MNNENFVEVQSVEEVESMQLALEKLCMFSGADATDTEVLRSRIEEQSTLISVLKQRTDELLLRCQALQKINSEFEDKIADRHKELEEERKKYKTLEKRFIDLAANNQAIIVFKDEYKSQNTDLRRRNQQLRSENESLFSKKLQENEATVERLEQELNHLKEKHAQKEYNYREKKAGFKAKLLKQTNDYEAKEASLIEKVQSLEEMQRKTAAMCDNLKGQLKNTKDEYTSKETVMMEATAALCKEKDTLLQVSVERGKLIQEKQEELEQMEMKVREEKKLRTKAEERFKQESQLVNADARVRALQSDLGESTMKYEKLKKEFEAFKQHSKNLLIHERELNNKLRLMTGSS